MWSSFSVSVSLLFLSTSLCRGLPEVSSMYCGDSPQQPLTSGALHRRSYFYVGQTYRPINPDEDSGLISFSQVYVERLTPAVVTKPFPLLFIHGGGMTATNFLNTPDGRMGGADHFLEKGYEVYLLDQPSRGRSPWRKSIDGPQVNFDTRIVETRFTAPELFNVWPQANLHTQWPGNGSVGDPVFDAFYASMMPTLIPPDEVSEKMKAAGSKLLDMIGPVIIITHSQAGQFGFILADSRPNFVKALISLESSGPPFVDAVFPPLSPARPYGLTEIPITFDPPITAASDLQRVAVNLTAHTPGSWLYTCYQQSAPAQKMVNLADVPMLVVTTESSYHAVYDECTVEFLRQGGVEKLDHVRLFVGRANNQTTLT